MHESCSPKVMGVVRDDRGWGRMSGVVMQGVGGKRLLLLDVYWPVRSGDSLKGAMWNRQGEEMVRLGMVKEGSKPDPRKQLMLDMRVLMMEWGSKRDVSIVMLGDMNLPVMRDRCEDKRRREEWDEWSEVLQLGGMLNMSSRVWGRKGGMWSYESGHNQSWIDWVCVSKGVVEAGGVTGLWMIDKTVMCSDHRSMMVDLDWEVVLGMAMEADVVKQGKGKGVRLLDRHDSADVKKFGRLLGDQVEMMEGEGMEGMVREVEEMSGEWLRGGDEGKVQQLREAMETAFQAYSKVMKETEEAMVNPMPEKRRHGWSRVMVGDAKALRAVRRLQRWARWRQCAALEVKVEEGRRLVKEWSGEVIDPPPESAGLGALEGWERGVERVVDRLKGRLHGTEKERSRSSMTWYLRKREESRQVGKLRDYLRSVLKLEAARSRLRCVKREVEVGGVRRVEVLTQAVEVCTAATSFFEEWFGVGRDRWYLGKWGGEEAEHERERERVRERGGTCVEETGVLHVGYEMCGMVLGDAGCGVGEGEAAHHPLWRNSEEGREMRVRLDEGDGGVVDSVPLPMREVARACERLRKRGADGSRGGGRGGVRRIMRWMVLVSWGRSARGSGRPTGGSRGGGRVEGGVVTGWPT